MAKDIVGQKRRSGGRRGNARRLRAGAISQMPFKPPINTDAPIEPLYPTMRRSSDRRVSASYAPTVTMGTSNQLVDD